MAAPVFLTEEQTIALNRRAIEKDGGAHAVLDRGLLSSAVAMPRASFGGRYLHESIAAMAAAYLFHICQAHAFQDGNKRTAVLAAVVFLDLNGYDLDATEESFEEVVMGIAAHQVGKDKVTAFFEKHAVARKG
jgi:death-on-curing protein